MNTVSIVGNLSRDVEIRYSQGGSAIANCGIAVNKKWKDQATGQMKEKVMFIDITAYARTGEILNQYGRKGSKIGIVGELEFQQWTAQDGSKRSKHAINIKDLELLDPKPSNGNYQAQNQYADQQAQYDNGGQPQQNSGYSQPQQGTTQYAQNENGQPQQQYKDDGQPANYEQSQQYRNQNNNNGNSNPAPQGGYSDPQGQRQ